MTFALKCQNIEEMQEARLFKYLVVKRASNHPPKINTELMNLNSKHLFRTKSTIVD